MVPSRILVATDGSEPAKAAVEFAAEIVKIRKPETIDEIEVITVVPLKQVLEIKASPDQRAYYEGIADEAFARLKELLGDYPVSVKKIVVEASSVSEAILNHAQKGGVCRHIVLGDRGQGRLASLLLGSVAHSVVENAKCPVTVIRI